ncbi:general odorant-binding protein 57c-like [Musca vetustissima]|uniref:general odorant-binding protein 57c-like n=1 Tax=Musca vetustissima TaxID=27455 RepID=UPI002AB7457F|nr:general odorant-binding protein 57c-like [Musca vetustissima]
MHLIEIAFGFVLTVALIHGETFQEFRHNECIHQHRLDDDEYKTMKDLMSTIPSDIDMRYKCYMHCMLMGRGHLDKDERYRMEWIQEDYNLPEYHVRILENCKEQHKQIEDRCEYVFQMEICSMEVLRDYE